MHVIHLLKDVRRLCRILVLPLLVSATESFAQAAPAEEAARKLEELKGAASQVAAVRAGVAPGSLKLLNAAVARYPLTRRMAYEYKIANPRTLEIIGVTLDERGRELPSGLLWQAEREASRAKYKNLTVPLWEALQTAGADEQLRVHLWLADNHVPLARPTPEAARKMTPAQLEERVKMSVEASKASVSRVAIPVLARLRAMGVSASAQTEVPVVYAQLTRAQLLKVSDWPEVLRADLGEGRVEGELHYSRPTIRADAVNNRDLPGTTTKINGAGIKVAIIDHQGNVAKDNPYLSGITQEETFMCATPGNHITGIAGIIKSTHRTHHGVATGVDLWAGGVCDSADLSRFENLASRASSWGAKVISMSYGNPNSGTKPGSHDAYFDRLVLDRWITVVKSAGNTGDRITSPGLAYNSIAVGNFRDNRTVSWDDDSMNITSSYINPASTYGDREKPEVVAPGTTIVTTTTASPWTESVGLGTSLSAPHVAATAALLMQRNSALRVWPEAVKAILMTTAIHNIEGDRRLSDQDGAGGIVAAVADDLVAGVNGSWGTLNDYSCDTVTPLQLTSFVLESGKRLRATVSWAQNPSDPSYADRPGADLDLLVSDSIGNPIAGSSSWDNNSEIIDFTTTRPDTYRLWLVKYRCDNIPQWVGWAWKKLSP
jgi:hypothetical protein